MPVLRLMVMVIVRIGDQVKRNNSVIVLTEGDVRLPSVFRQFVHLARL